MKIKTFQLVQVQLLISQCVVNYLTLSHLTLHINELKSIQLKIPLVFCLEQGRSTSPVKPQISPQPQNTDPDSGLDTFTRTMDHRSKYQHNNINAVPKAIPVR